jgi:hypothetical protein
MRGLFCLFVGEGGLCVSYLCVLCDSFFEQGGARENDESVGEQKFGNLKFNLVGV